MHSTAQIPAALDAPGALRDVQAIAEEAGLSMTRLTPAPALVRDAETEWTVTLEFEAAYNDLVRFLQAVADERRLLTVTALRLHSPGTAADGITGDAVAVVSPPSCIATRARRRVTQTARQMGDAYG